MGLITTSWPNHMAASTPNPFWLDMLEGAPTAPPPAFSTRLDKGRLVLPVLGDPLQATIEAGQITLAVNEARAHRRGGLWRTAFPLRQESIAELVARLPAASTSRPRRRARHIGQIGHSAGQIGPHRPPHCTHPPPVSGGRIDLSGLDPVTRLAFDTVLGGSRYYLPARSPALASRLVAHGGA